ncbi:MAG: DNA polymerase I [Finegoldia magna]|uniref:DNA polymerase I n=1 Tax=Finegoldia magna TaxID=1260 RepID=UPI00290DBB90|nr:DNA polymerase I [Finegoldia magna]MDU5272461.1 DNA polymerase I [Finegoldia magna]
MSKKALIIDGSSLLFRGFYAIRDLTTKDGIHTNGVFGFMNMYYSVMGKINPDLVVVCFDRKEPTFRHEKYSEYKGNRQETPEELIGQFDMLKELLKAMGVSYIDLKGYEADDIAGTLAKQASSKDYDVYLLTGDKDYLQLIDDNTKVVLTKRGITETKIYDVDILKEEYGITPKQMIDLKGLMGDKSDNIPGIDGVGEKTALKYIQKYGSIEGLYEHVDEISGKKTKQKVIDGEDIAYLSRELGTINTDVPEDLMGFGIEDCTIKEADNDHLIEVLTKLEFNSFIKKLPNEESNEKFEYENLDEKVDEIKAYIKENKKFTFALFNDDYYVDNEPVIFAIYTDKVYITRNVDLVESFKEEFESKDINKLSFDIKPCIYHLMRYGIDISYNYDDVVIIEYLLDPSKTSYSMERSDPKVIGYDFKPLEDITGKGKSKKTILESDEKEIDNYVVKYMMFTNKLYEKISEIEEEDMMHLYRDVEIPLIKVLCDMEFTGVCVKKETLVEMGELFEDEIKSIEKSVEELIGKKININSSKQLAEVLFEDLELPVIKKNKTGPSTDQEVLEALSGRHEIIDYILRYRTITKLKTTYIDGMVDLIKEDGKIHTTFQQTIAQTGRISSTNPNLQNIPIRTEEGRLIRKAFVPSEGNMLLDADYSQIELRVLADLANDEVMLDAFKHGADIHRKTASEVFKVDFDKVTSLQRSNAKAVNFGIVYGIGDYSLSKDLHITRKEAKEYIENYLDTYKGIKQYMEDIVAIGKEKGYVETIMNRRRYIPELKSKNYNVRSFGERVALNTPIQGSAADIIKVAMVKFYNRLSEEKLKAKLILQVHDELIVDCPKDEREKVLEIMKDVMTHAVDLKVDMKIDVNSADNWYDAK